jgi:hypothetical protein
VLLADFFPLVSGPAFLLQGIDGAAEVGRFGGFSDAGNSREVFDIAAQ